MNDRINIAQWIAFVGPQILLIFQIWREGRFDRQSNAKNWADNQKNWADNQNKWLETQRELLKISQRVERLESKLAG